MRNTIWLKLLVLLNIQIKKRFIESLLTIIRCKKLMNRTDSFICLKITKNITLTKCKYTFKIPIWAIISII